MSESKIFDEARWPLHIALAWRLSKCPDYLDKVQPGTFGPLLPWPDGHSRVDAASQAWREIHDLMSSTTLPISGSGHVQIQTFGVAAGSNDEAPIPPEVVAGLDWSRDEMGEEVILVTRRGLPRDPAAVYRRVTVSAAAVRHNFLANSPLLSARGNLGPAIDPRSTAYLRLSDAAYWVATNGNRSDFFESDTQVWARAYEDLLGRIQRGAIAMIGRGRDGINDSLGGFLLAGLKVSFPEPLKDLDSILWRKPQIAASSVNVSQEDWERGDCDKIFGAGGELIYSHLQVSGADVWSAFPCTEISAAAAARGSEDAAAGTFAAKAEGSGSQESKTRRSPKNDAAALFAEWPGGPADPFPRKQDAASFLKTTWRRADFVRAWTGYCVLRNRPEGAPHGRKKHDTESTE